MSREVKIGMLVFVSILAAVWGYAFLKGRNLLTNSYTFYARFHDVGQLPMSSPVLISGYQIGTVSDINLDQEDMKTVIVEMTVEKKFDIPRDAVVKLVSTSIMGGKALELDLSGPCVSDCARSGDFLKARVEGPLEALLGESSVDDALSGLGKGIGSAFDSINVRLADTSNQGRITRIVYNIDMLIQGLVENSQSLNGLIHHTGHNLNMVTTNLNAVISNLKDNNETIEALLSNTAGVTAQLNESDLKGAIDGMKDATKSADETFNSLGEAMKGLEGTIASLDDIATSIKNGDGTLGKAVQDEELYDNLNRASKNLDLLLQDLRLNPKRYLGISVFGKKQKDYVLPGEDPAK